MKKFTKILVASVLILVMALPFASCSMLFHSNDKLNSIENEMRANGYSVDTTADRYSMSYMLGFDIEKLPVAPVYMLTAYDTYHYEFVLCVFEFESEEGLNESFDMLAGAFNSIYDEIGEARPLYNISTTNNVFVAGVDGAYSIAMDAIHKSTNSFSGIFEDIFDICGEIFDFVEKEIVERIIEAIERDLGITGGEDSFDIYTLEKNLAIAEYEISIDANENNVYLLAQRDNRYISVWQTQDIESAEREYNTLIEMWDEIVDSLNAYGFYNLSYGIRYTESGAIVYYGTQDALYDAFGFNVSL